MPGCSLWAAAGALLGWLARRWLIHHLGDDVAEPALLALTVVIVTMLAMLVVVFLPWGEW